MNPFKQLQSLNESSGCAFRRESHRAEIYVVNQHRSGFFPGFERTEDVAFAEGCGSVQAGPLQDGLQTEGREMLQYALEFFNHGQYVVGR